LRAVYQFLKYSGANRAFFYIEKGGGLNASCLGRPPIFRQLASPPATIVLTVPPNQRRRDIAYTSIYSSYYTFRRGASGCIGSDKGTELSTADPGRVTERGNSPPIALCPLKLNDKKSKPKKGPPMIQAGMRAFIMGASPMALHS
jgi:hypothetical protein